MNTLFYADPHFGHANILKYCGRTMFMTKEDKAIYYYRLEQGKERERSFIISKESLDKMDNSLIKRWNEKVKKEDTVINIGDWGFRNSLGGKVGEGSQVRAREWEAKLNGKVIYIEGNHDKNNGLKTKIQRLVIKIGGHRINLVHKPKHADFNYSINFTGHIHNLWKIKRFYDNEYFRITDCINVGVDVWDYRPVSFNELMKRYYRWLNKNGYKIGGI